jgi:hypothetical protein
MASLSAILDSDCAVCFETRTGEVRILNVQTLQPQYSVIF